MLSQTYISQFIWCFNVPLLWTNTNVVLFRKLTRLINYTGHRLKLWSVLPIQIPKRMSHPKATYTSCWYPRAGFELIALSLPKRPFLLTKAVCSRNIEKLDLSLPNNSTSFLPQSPLQACRILPSTNTARTKRLTTRMQNEAPSFFKVVVNFGVIYSHYK